MYITINDIVLNAGSADEVRRPYEIFINSKNMEHFQWIAALTLVISAVFRKGGDMAFLVDELKSVFDPRGGYWKPGASDGLATLFDGFTRNELHRDAQAAGLLKA